MATATITGPEQVDEGRVEGPGAFTTRSPEEVSRRRFTIAAVTGTALTLPFTLWLLWDLWSGRVNVIRGVSFDYFYDRQARAIFHGHLWIPNGELSIEAFAHAGHQITYFGLFPSLIRMPILLFTSRLDGDLTAPSLLLAWFATAVFTALLLWRLRVLIRGTGLVLGRAEAASYGVLMAGVMAGSVVIYLAATPFVYNEDFAWSIPLVLGSLFVLLGIQERPSWGQTAAAAVLVVCTNLNRTPGGYAVTIGCVLVAAWFALGKGGTAGRRWAIPLAAIGVVGFLVNAAVNYGNSASWSGCRCRTRCGPTSTVPPLLPRRQRRKAGEPRPYPCPVVGLLPAFRSPVLYAVPVHHPARVPRLRPRVRDGVDLSDGQHDHDGTVAHGARRLGDSDGVPAAGSRSRAPGAADHDHHGRGDRRGRRLGLHLPAVHRRLHAVLHYRVRGRHDRSLASPRGAQPQGAGMGARGPLRTCHIWGRRQRGRRRVPVPQFTQTQLAGYVAAQQSLSLGSLGASVRTGRSLPYWAPAGQLSRSTTARASTC